MWDGCRVGRLHAVTGGEGDGVADPIAGAGYREKCETKTILGARFAKKPIEIDIPIYITGMSFGALSLEAKMALAKGASMAGTATCSGEGGMIPPERDHSLSIHRVDRRHSRAQHKRAVDPHLFQ